MLTKASEMSKYGHKDFYTATYSYMHDKCLIDNCEFNISEVMQEALFDLIDSSKISSHFIKDAIRYNGGIMVLNLHSQKSALLALCLAVCLLKMGIKLVNMIEVTLRKKLKNINF